MKNVQVIDSADNCTFPIFQFTEAQYILIFSNFGQDIAFIEEVTDRLSDDEMLAAFSDVWDRPVDKYEIVGLHGTLFYEFEDRKSHFPATRRECDFDDSAVNAAQRLLNARKRQKFAG
jgi:hypothetical protein